MGLPGGDWPDGDDYDVFHDHEEVEPDDDVVGEPDEITFSVN
jgi:hypothetical protein